MQNSITIIATDLLVAEKTQRILHELGSEYSIVFSENNNLEKLSKSLVSQGVKVIITFGMFAKIIRQYVEIPVIMVDLRAEDVLDGLREAAHLGSRVAIFGFRKLLKNVYYVKDLLNFELICLDTVSPEEIPDVIAKLDHVDVLVGGYYQVKIARRYGIQTVLVNPRDSEIRKAVVLAQSYLKKQDEIVPGKRPLESSVYASITVDNQGDILMMNRLASEYLGLNHINAVAFSVEEVCPQFSRIADVLSTGRSYLNQIAEINERVFLYHAEPILNIESSELEGVAVIFQDVNSVMRSDASIRRKMITRENQAVYTFDNILGNSASMTKTLKSAIQYSKVDEPVLILGETGVGKEMFAQAIHRASNRKDNPFVAINCASLPESILESELFGYVKGAFTGANREGKKGLFEYAHTGTIFLDEIGELSLAMQGKLLRVLQEYSIRRIGGETPIPVDIRIITATNRDLISMVREGKFRADLYFRINVLGLTIPPLRERREDILLLAEVFLTEYAHRSGRNFSFSEEAKQRMQEYMWPGNIRELQNMIRRMTVICESEEIGVFEVEDYIRENQKLLLLNQNETPVSYPVEMLSKKKMSLEEALALSKGNKVQAAELLGVSRATLYRMLERREK